jgi:hypothetical protein
MTPRKLFALVDKHNQANGAEEPEPERLSMRELMQWK